MIEPAKKLAVSNAALVIGVVIIVAVLDENYDYFGERSR